MSILSLPPELLIKIDFLSSPCSNLYSLHPVVTRGLRSATRRIEVRLLHSPSQLSSYSQLREVVLHSLNNYEQGLAGLLPSTVNSINIYNVMYSWILLKSIPEHVTSVTMDNPPLIWGRDYFDDLFGYRNRSRGVVTSLNLLHEGITTIRVNGGVYDPIMRTRPIVDISAEIDVGDPLPPTLTRLHNSLWNRGYMVSSKMGELYTLNRDRLFDREGIEQYTIEDLTLEPSHLSKSLTAVAITKLTPQWYNVLLHSNVTTLIFNSLCCDKSLSSLRLTTLLISKEDLSAEVLPRTLTRLKIRRILGGPLPDLIWLDTQSCLAKLPSTLRVLICDNYTWGLAVGIHDNERSLHDSKNVPQLHTLDLAYFITRGHHELHAKDFPESLTSLAFSDNNRLVIRSLPPNLLHLHVLSLTDELSLLELPPRLQTLESYCILDEESAKRLPRTLSSLRCRSSLIGAYSHLPPHLVKFTEGNGSSYGRIVRSNVK